MRSRRSNGSIAQRCYLSIAYLGSLRPHAECIWQNANQCMLPTIGIDTSLAKIHIPSTFGIYRDTTLHHRTYTGKHTSVFRKLFREDFGETTSEIEQINIFWQLIILQRAKRDNFNPHISQNLQHFWIVKREGHIERQP